VEDRNSYTPDSSPAHPLPSGRFPLAVHMAVLRRFMSASRNGVEPVAPETVEEQGVPPGAARENAAFLSDLGLLIEERPGQFKPTPVAMQLINTQLSDEKRGRRLLRSIVAKTWFAGSAAALLRRERTRPVDEAELLVAVASDAHLPAASDLEPIRVLVEYLVYSEVIVLPARQTHGPSGSARAAVLAPPNATQEPPAGVLRPEHSPSSPDQRGPADWEVIQTSEFSLRIQPSRAAVKRLRKQLDMLDEKLKERP
jgi:hypothetical protein